MSAILSRMDGVEKTYDAKRRPAMSIRRILIPAFAILLTTLLLAGLAAYPAHARAVRAPATARAALQATPVFESLSVSSGEWKRISKRDDLKRSGITGAYDLSRKKIVTFGGVSPSGAFLADTLMFSGSNWLFVGTAHKPPARKWYGLVYDPRRKVFVLFGGQNEHGNLNDTWEFQYFTILPSGRKDFPKCPAE